MTRSARSVANFRIISFLLRFELTQSERIMRGLPPTLPNKSCISDCVDAPERFPGLVAYRMDGQADGLSSG